MNFLSKIINKYPKQFLVLGLLYIASPIDFLPEIPFGPIGLLDDAAILGLLMTAVKELVFQKFNPPTKQTSHQDGSDVIDVDSEKID